MRSSDRQPVTPLRMCVGGAMKLCSCQELRHKGPCLMAASAPNLSAGRHFHMLAQKGLHKSRTK